MSVGILAGIGILGLLSYNLVFFESVRQDTALTVERARQIGCPLPLPDSATTVHFAIYHNWGENDIYLKFKDDTSVCQQWVKTVVDANAQQNKYATTQTNLQRLTSPPEIKSWGGTGPLPWFNISRIVEGSCRPGGPNDPEIWIDNDRGIFYCRIRS